MKFCTVLLAACAAALPVLRAQEPADEFGPKGPKTPAHEALATLVGDWETVCKIPAMPGVPGMEEAVESKGTEHTELLCNGLWLRSTLTATYKGAPFHGVWIAGYDPAGKQYKSIWISTEDQGASFADGSYDAETKTFTFHGDSPMGPVRSTLAFASADQSVETCYTKGPDGKEVQCMQITRSRSKGARAGDAVATGGKPPSKELAVLHETIGTWDATVKTSMPGQEPVEHQCIEKVVPACGGKWIWSDFTGLFMGAPFEGHALSGYDEGKQQYVSFWFDSMSPAWMQTTGTYDAAERTFTLDGRGVDEAGKPMTVHEIAVHKDADTREVKMTFASGATSQTMEIRYRRQRKG